MAGNPLVAQPTTTVSPYAGAFVLQDGQSLVDAIHSGDWVDGGIAALSAGLDTAAAVSDPLGTLIANGLGWLIDHLDPLKTWMDQLTGDASEVAAFAQTWQNVAGRMHDSASLYEARLSDLDGMSGATVEAYLAFAEDTVKHLNASGQWASAVGTGLQVASELVQAVHDLVVQVLSQLVGSIISMAAEAIFTLGLATPLIVEQVSTRVADLAEEIGSRLTRLLTSFKSLEGILARLRGVFEDAGALLRDMLRGGGDDVDAASTAAEESVADDGLTAAERQRIIDTPKGERPDPSTYLSPEYIEQHLKQFDAGGTRYMLTKNLDKYGVGQSDGTSFIMPTSEVDSLITSTGSDPRAMEQALGLPDGYFNDPVTRVDIPPDRFEGLRMPSGNEAGANPEWIPGGHLPTGVSEAVIDVGNVPRDVISEHPAGLK